MIEDDERDGRRHKLDAGFILLETHTVLAHLFAKPASNFCHISAWIERRDESQAHLLQSKATRGRNLMVL
ncbi:MAG: hypothetical protein QGI24_04810 [Kiritimatiellia bacterium]|jgi:hypothetical protein|nr:hypothetical protein [Kiritimatiellia bacterium]MDP6848088.1 hypothetical protein [Kiritimatiellia bacterium]